MRIGIFPGSFDPIHNGHLAIAQTAADHLELDQVIFVPSGVSPNKRRTQKTPGKIRFDWIQLALQNLGDNRLIVSDIESSRNTVTYTLESVQELGSAKGISKENLFMLVGADTAARMQRWPSYQQILKIATIADFGRDGVPGSIPAYEYPHASSDIKRRIWLNQSIEDMVPRNIVKQITERFKNESICKPGFR